MADPANIDEMLNDLFSYHPPSADDLVKYQAVRKSALSFAQVVFENCPPSADRTHVLRTIRTAVMFANASIALKGRS